MKFVVIVGINMKKDASKLVACLFKSEGRMTYVSRNTSLETLVGFACSNWKVLSQDTFRLVYLIPDEEKCRIPLLSDLDVQYMIDMAFEHALPSLKVYVEDITILDGSTERTSQSSQATTLKKEGDIVGEDWIYVEGSQPKEKEKMVDLWVNKLTDIEQEFLDVITFHHALCRYAIAWGFNYKFLRNYPKRVTAKCVKENCLWNIHAVRVSMRGTFEIKKFYKKHACDGGIATMDHPRASKMLVADIVESKFVMNL